MEAGYQFGLADIHLTPAGRDDPLFAGLGWSHVQLHHHGEAITTLARRSGQVRRHAGSSLCQGLADLRVPIPSRVFPRPNHELVAKPSSWMTIDAIGPSRRRLCRLRTQFGAPLLLMPVRVPIPEIRH